MTIAALGYYSGPTPNAQLSLLNKGLTYNISSHKLYTHIQYTLKYADLKEHYNFTTSSQTKFQTHTNNPNWWPPKLSSKITNFCQELITTQYTQTSTQTKQ